MITEQMDWSGSFPNHWERWPADFAIDCAVLHPRRPTLAQVVPSVISLLLMVMLHA